MTSTHTAWTGMLPVDDTALYVNDTGGPGQPVVYLNGAYADQSHWKRVIADFGTGYRHITYDQRARGKSGRSTDYSFRLHESGSSGNCQGRQYTGYQGTTIEYQWGYVSTSVDICEVKVDGFQGSQEVDWGHPVRQRRIPELHRYAPSPRRTV